MAAKIKTSVSVSKKTLAALKKIAAQQDRSVSYVLEKFIESKVQELPDKPDEKVKALPILINERPRHRVLYEEISDSKHARRGKQSSGSKASDAQSRRKAKKPGARETT